LFSISEEPDVRTAGAAGWAVEAAGHLKKLRSYEILTPEEMMGALRKAGVEALRTPNGSDGSS
jgi:hypothetical protein